MNDVEKPDINDPTYHSVTDILQERNYKPFF